jgi:hypothetical protein
MKIDWQVHQIDDKNVMTVTLVTPDEDANFTFGTVIGKMNEVGLSYKHVLGERMLVFSNLRYVNLSEKTLLPLMEQGKNIRTVIINPVLPFANLKDWDGLQELIYLYNNR